MSYLEGHGSSLHKPPQEFLAKLRRLDPKLGCFFNPDAEVYVITYTRASGEPIPIAKCAGRDADGTFRHPDERDLAFIKSGDMMNKRVQDKMAEVADYMEKYRENVRQRHSENIRNMTKDDKIQLQNAAARVADGGKHNSAFPVRSRQAKGFGRKLVSGPGKPTDLASRGL